MSQKPAKKTTPQGKIRGNKGSQLSLQYLNLLLSLATERSTVHCTVGSLNLLFIELILNLFYSNFIFNRGRPVAGSMVISNQWLRSIETYTFL